MSPLAFVEACSCYVSQPGLSHGPPSAFQELEFRMHDTMPGQTYLSSTLTCLPLYKILHSPFLSALVSFFLVDILHLCSQCSKCSPLCQSQIISVLYLTLAYCSRMAISHLHLEDVISSFSAMSRCRFKEYCCLTALLCCFHLLSPL